MLKHTPIIEAQHCAFALKIKLFLLTFAKLISFDSLQKALFSLSIFVYHDLNQDFIIDLNLSKKFDFSAIFFHVKYNRVIIFVENWPNKLLVQPLFFFI